MLRCWPKCCALAFGKREPRRKPQASRLGWLDLVLKQEQSQRLARFRSCRHDGETVLTRALGCEAHLLDGLFACFTAVVLTFFIAGLLLSPALQARR